MHVMIAIDGTEAATGAADVAVEMFGPDADYTIVSIGTVAPVHAITPLGVQPALMQLTMSGDDTIDPWVQPEALIEEMAERLAAERIETVVGVGAPGPALCDLAADRGADVLVLGAHDRGFLSRLLEPSVARHAIENAPCHVLVVRGDTDHSAP